MISYNHKYFLTIFLTPVSFSSKLLILGASQIPLLLYSRQVKYVARRKLGCKEINEEIMHRRVHTHVSMLYKFENR